MSETNFVGGMGLADMAMRLAELRASKTHHEIIGFWTYNRIEPCDREIVNPAIHPVSAGYYQIIDRIARGEQP
jgi:hypothetical protein